MPKRGGFYGDWGADRGIDMSPILQALVRGGENIAGALQHRREMEARQRQLEEQRAFQKQMTQEERAFQLKLRGIDQAERERAQREQDEDRMFDAGVRDWTNRLWALLGQSERVPDDYVITPESRDAQGNVVPAVTMANVRQQLGEVLGEFPKLYTLPRDQRQGAFQALTGRVSEGIVPRVPGLAAAFEQTQRERQQAEQDALTLRQHFARVLSEAGHQSLATRVLENPRAPFGGALRDEIMAALGGPDRTMYAAMRPEEKAEWAVEMGWVRRPDAPPLEPGAEPPAPKVPRAAWFTPEEEARVMAELNRQMRTEVGELQREIRGLETDLARANIRLPNELHQAIGTVRTPAEARTLISRLRETLGAGVAAKEERTTLEGRVLTFLRHGFQYDTTKTLEQNTADFLKQMEEQKNAEAMAAAFPIVDRDMRDLSEWLPADNPLVVAYHQAVGPQAKVQAFNALAQSDVFRQALTARREHIGITREQETEQNRLQLETLRFQRANQPLQAAVAKNQLIGSLVQSRNLAALPGLVQEGLLSQAEANSVRDAVGREERLREMGFTQNYINVFGAPPAAFDAQGRFLTAEQFQAAATKRIDGIIAGLRKENVSQQTLQQVRGHLMAAYQEHYRGIQREVQADARATAADRRAEAGLHIDSARLNLAQAELRLAMDRARRQDRQENAQNLRADLALLSNQRQLIASEYSAQLQGLAEERRVLQCDTELGAMNARCAALASRVQTLTANHKADMDELSSTMNRLAERAGMGTPPPPARVAMVVGTVPEHIRTAAQEAERIGMPVEWVATLARAEPNAVTTAPDGSKRFGMFQLSPAQIQNAGRQMGGDTGRQLAQNPEALAGMSAAIQGQVMATVIQRNPAMRNARTPDELAVAVIDPRLLTGAVIERNLPNGQPNPAFHALPLDLQRGDRVTAFSVMEFYRRNPPTGITYAAPDDPTPTVQVQNRLNALAATNHEFWTEINTIRRMPATAQRDNAIRAFATKWAKQANVPAISIVAWLPLMPDIPQPARPPQAPRPNVPILRPHTEPPPATP